MTTPAPGTTLTADEIAALPAGSMVEAIWDPSSPHYQPAHYVIRSGARTSGAASAGFTIATERDWAALPEWDATITLVSVPAFEIRVRRD